VPPGTLALMRRVKEQFDPGHRLAPGRFVGGIAGADGKPIELPRYTATTTLSPEQQMMLRLCRHQAQTVADIASESSLPVGVVRVLLGDLLAAGPEEVDAAERVERRRWYWLFSPLGFE
jgi:hypothetical protein